MNNDFTEKNRLWLSGESIPELGFRFNSVVEAMDSDGEKIVGWIVSADIVDGHATYTVEARDGSGDYVCPEAVMRYYENKENEA